MMSDPLHAYPCPTCGREMRTPDMILFGIHDGDVMYCSLPCSNGAPCERHEWMYLGGHNEWWVCRKCGGRKR